MRLLHASELEFEEFSPSVIPRYAILSHRWGKEEVIFEDMMKGLAQTKEGYSKIAGSCKQAKNDGYEYIWVDTCCINKDSSAELSEAINSMYAWYKNAGICYAYLVDVPDEVNPKEDAKFASSDWFNRGWTLQELLAPDEVVFFSTGWTRLGDKSSLCSTLSRITRIDKEVLAGMVPVESLSVAKRMSWASRRGTSRPEDIAYCLMGLFDVNMPMLYGEGKRAFIRLQEEIMKDSDDESLFAWMNGEASPHSLHGLLAESPAWFNHSRDVETSEEPSLHQPFSKTNKGLHIYSSISQRQGGCVLTLNCIRAENSERLRVCLRQVDGYEQYARIMANELLWQDPFKCKTGHEKYARVLANELWYNPGGFWTRNGQSVYVRQDLRTAQCRPINLRPILRLRSWISFRGGYEVHKIASCSDTWESHQVNQIHVREMNTWEYYLRLPYQDNIIVLILVLQRVETKRFFAITFASSSEKGITFNVRNCDDLESSDFEKFTWSPSFHYPGDVVWIGGELVRVHAETSIRDVGLTLSSQGPRVLQAHYMVDIEIQDAFPKQESTQANTSATGNPKSPDIQA